MKPSLPLAGGAGGGPGFNGSRDARVLARAPISPPLNPLPRAGGEMTGRGAAMDVTDLRIALFSGNYNYVRDGANQALNRLVEYLLRQGASVRIYSPTVKEPAFAANG